MDKVINSRDAAWLNKVGGEWKGLATPSRPETATLPQVEAVEEMKALAEKNVCKAHCGLRCHIAQCLASNVFKWAQMTRNLAFPNTN